MSTMVPSGLNEASRKRLWYIRLEVGREIIPPRRTATKAEIKPWNRCQVSRKRGLFARRGERNTAVRSWSLR